MMRPIFLEFPEVFTPPSNGFGNLDTEFLLGPSLLVAPQPFAETLDDYVVSFPERRVVRLLDRPQGAAAPVPEPNIVEIANASARNGPPRTPSENSSRARHPAGVCPGRKHSAAAAAHSKHR